MYDCHVVIDFEFNPTDQTHRSLLSDEIIEIGAVKLNPRCEEIGKFSCLVKPQMNTVVEGKITNLTSIRTSDVMQAVEFSEALRMLSEWIGDCNAKIYTWSNNDFIQIENECAAKGLVLPGNMSRWMDLQKVFQRIIHYPHRMCMGLSYAANMLNILFDGKSAHRALYDAEITAEILRTIKSEEYHNNLKKAMERFVTEQRPPATYSLGSACSSVFSELMLRFSVA